MADRTKKYAKKIDGKIIGDKYDATKDLAVKSEGKALKEAVEVEEKVKGLLSSVSTLQISYYIIFAKEILKVMRKHNAETQEQEICILCRKWWMRGLQAINLNIISNCYAGMACFDIGDKYGLPWTGQTTIYQAGDDGTYQMGTTINRPIVKGVGSHRFTDNGDGTITDEGTGLMWVKDPINNPGAPFNAMMTWADAITNCEALDFAGHDDWRLPNIKELMSIADYANFNPAIDGTFFPNTQPDRYWSSTTSAGWTIGAWYVSFTSGTVSDDSKGNAYYVRAVRLGKP